ncbi:Zn-dependent alcohol dehydrogenase [Siccirubricoccus sp. KC 17139]|uniref:Zn-dependent alcohol dehydrogenase n=1 Tax=Siccirubricoccus soli TaxID=2899147 RepID=A0ABT1DCJ2_9PROT|nr:Zn-dependent alcohol dehydrogenase [Siccirubricoccus soli]MCO6419653.1 Zn-dependent alcohol dehydrogenase [Siccirubricoccus soli]MCP2685788.1 Zn-dependent alcohol dehydrogenase [Siccirubricoccus soli]
MQARAAVLRAIGQPMAIERIRIAPLAPGDVLVKTAAASLCHTDLEVIEGQFGLTLPAVLGHEAAGTIAALGEGVTGLAPGDPVVLSWNPHCGGCFYCRRAQPILCEPYLANGPKAVHFDGRPRLACDDGATLHQLMYLGGFAEYVVVPVQQAVRVPREMPLDRACLLGCAVMTGFGAATHIARIGWGEVVMVIGAGAVGLAAIQGARLAGAGRIIAVDPNPARRAMAERAGATTLCDPAQEDPAALARRLTAGRGADAVIEAAGVPASLRASVEAVRPGGQVVWLGKLGVNAEMPFRWGALMQEKRITRSSYGGARPAEDFPLLAEAYLAGKLDLDSLITARIGLEEINQGFAALKRGEAIRSVVVFP